MHTLREYPVYQHKGEPRRRWFTDDFFDIFVWFHNDDSTITGFQLCYDKQAKERALTWIRGRGFRHDLIDDGETTPTKNRAPILVRDEEFPASEVLVLFITSSGGIEERIRALIIEKLCLYGDLPALESNLLPSKTALHKSALYQFPSPPARTSQVSAAQS